MGDAWTSERVLGLAPDAASAAAGKGLASEGKWELLGRSDRAAWGLCQGSGKNPYQTRADLREPAFKCSCPSRKFPCKHAIGLMLLLAKSSSKMAVGNEPGWVAEWLAERESRAEKKAQKAEQAAAEPEEADAAAQAKRAADRRTRMEAGIAECRVWLTDLVRSGLAHAKGQPSRFWETAAARMVDAQAPGLGRLIRLMGEQAHAGEDWPKRMLDVAARMHLLTAAFSRAEALPAEPAADISGLLGINTPKDEILRGPGVKDDWVVVGMRQEEEDRLRIRRTWLWGVQSRREALILDFAAGAQPMNAAYMPGTEFTGELAFYPSASPLRALVKSKDGAVRPARASLGCPTSFDDGLSRYGAALAASPWLERWPLVLEGVMPVLQHSRLSIVDRESRALPIAPSFSSSWKLLALSGGGEVGLAAEWDGWSLLPLACWTAGNHHTLSRRGQP